MRNLKVLFYGFFYFFESVMILVGIIIGAGVFVLPYLGYLSGIIPVLFWLILSFLVILYLHLAFGEIILKTEREHRLIGYAHYYLGKGAKNLIILTTCFTFSFSLLVYLLLNTQFVNNIISAFIGFNLPPFYLFLLLWFVLNFLSLIPNQEKVSSFNFFLSFLILILFFLIGVFYYPFFRWDNLKLFPQETSSFNYFLKLILPYGVIFFALNGMVGVPEVIKHFKNRKLSLDQVPKAIFIGTLIPVICYFSFILLIDGFCGKNVSINAFDCLSNIIGQKIVIFGSLIGFLAVTTSYLIFALYLKNTFIRDLSLPPLLSNFLIFLGPLVFYLLKLTNLISLVSLLGGLIGGMEGIMILFILKTIKKKNLSLLSYSLPFNSFIFISLLIILIFGALCQTFLVPLIS